MSYPDNSGCSVAPSPCQVAIASVMVEQLECPIFIIWAQNDMECKISDFACNNDIIAFVYHSERSEESFIRIIRLCENKNVKSVKNISFRISSILNKRYVVLRNANRNERDNTRIIMIKYGETNILIIAVNICENITSYKKQRSF